MHFYFLTRGIKHDSDRMITELQGKYVPIQMKNVDDANDVLNMQVQLNLKPIQLWEVAFPKEHKDLILTTILGKCNPTELKDKAMDKYLWGLRTMLRSQKIGKYNDSHFLPSYKDNVQCVGIGIREDKDCVTEINGKKYIYEGI